jgi:sugar lactone lactonase YvrE
MYSPYNKFINFVLMKVSTDFFTLTRPRFAGLAAILLVYCSVSCSTTTDSPTGNVVITIAGNGKAGYLNGTGSGVEFNSPVSLILDAQSNIYVADKNNNRIRIIRTGNLVGDFAGNGIAGNKNGLADSAEFNNPQGVLVDAQGNVYVSDTYNYSIRKISSGQVSTFAGNGQSGFMDATGTNAQFVYPQGMALDQQGNIYVADNTRIRMITPSGVVSTLAGTGVSGYNDGSGLVAQFNGASAVATDAGGNVYVADFGNNRVRKITPTGAVSTLAGTGISGYMDGTGSVAQFKGPKGIALDAGGNVFVTEAGNNDIRTVTPAGVVSDFAGFSSAGYQDGPALSAQFDMPTGLAFDPRGALYICDTGNNYIRAVN